MSQLQRTFTNEFVAQAAEAIARRGKFIVGLPGGSVASAFFPILSGLDVDWTRIEIFWIDERAVPPDHPDSNYGLASRLLLVPARVPAARIHRMHGELPELDQAARRAADELRSIAGDPPRLDLALVGVGEDGHVASIFPSLSADPSTVARSAKVEARSAKAEAPRSQPVIAVYDSPKPPSRRLTLTLSVLASARHGCRRRIRPIEGRGHARRARESRRRNARCRAAARCGLISRAARSRSGTIIGPYFLEETDAYLFPGIHCCRRRVIVRRIA